MNYLALTLPGGIQIQPPANVPQGGLNTITKVVGNSITIMLILAVILSLIALIWGGARWVASGGDKAKLSAARSRITYAIIGLIVALLAFLIINIIGFFFQVNLLFIG